METSGLKIHSLPSFVVATTAEISKPTQFTSYISRDGKNDLFKTTQIWQAARATSAASGFFEPIKIGPHKEKFVDGATGANNPIEVLWDEARHVWPGDGRLEDNVRFIVSIGTGETTLEGFGSNVLEIGRTLQRMATQTQDTADRFKGQHDELFNNNRYFRFNVNHGLEHVGLEEWEQLAKVAASTRHYLRNDATRDVLNFVAANADSST